VDRGQWIGERRAAVVADYDADAATYDQFPYPNEVQREWVRRLLLTCPAGGLVLDAACGTGQYFSLVAEAGLRVVGTDQSAGMLAQARARGIALETHHVGLQELDFVGRFDAAMAIDAMENIAPEDWPVVLATLRRAVRPGGHIYLTVEEQDQADIEAAFAGLVRRGAPAVRGEVIDGDVAGYHYYPDREQVIGWTAAEGLDVVDEGFDQQEGWGYRHVLLRSP
jgi:SAM-dependent methyltransferase